MGRLEVWFESVPSSFLMYFRANDRLVSFLSTIRTLPKAPRPTTLSSLKWLRLTIGGHSCLAGCPGGSGKGSGLAYLRHHSRWASPGCFPSRIGGSASERWREGGDVLVETCQIRYIIIRYRTRSGSPRGRVAGAQLHACGTAIVRLVGSWGSTGRERYLVEMGAVEYVEVWL